MLSGSVAMNSIEREADGRLAGLGSVSTPLAIIVAAPD